MIDFTHAIYDDDGNVLRKLRLSKKEFDWYKSEKPYLIIRKLETTKQKNINQQELFNQIGECLF
jgi:hypothetical protein